ncbi:MAG TPA: LytR C-terminal domain-containing protein [Acidimicrobiia bacterium]|jgi:hypothetical protein
MSDTTLLPGEQPRRRPGRGSDGHQRAYATRGARGALLIGLAVILGIVLLQVVDKGNEGPIGDQKTSSTKAATTTTTKLHAVAPPRTTATTARPVPARTPAQIVVAVLNGSGQTGVAGTLTTQLKNKGYQTVTAQDTTQRTGSVVYYRSGYSREAAALAAQISGNPKLAPMPSPPPSNADANANLVVVIGA